MATSHKETSRIITEKGVEHLESWFQSSLEKDAIFCLNAKESDPIVFSHEIQLQGRAPSLTYFSVSSSAAGLFTLFLFVVIELELF